MSHKEGCPIDGDNSREVQCREFEDAVQREVWWRKGSRLWREVRFSEGWGLRLGVGCIKG